MWRKAIYLIMKKMRLQTLSNLDKFYAPQTTLIAKNEASTRLSPTGCRLPAPASHLPETESRVKTFKSTQHFKFDFNCIWINLVNLVNLETSLFYQGA